MGNCLCGGGGGARNVGTSDELLLSVSFESLPPLTVAVRHGDTLAAVRAKVEATMEKRANEGLPTAPVMGHVMTMRAGGGDACRIADSSTVKKAKLEPRQTIWFSDQAEDDRVKAVVLRSSRLTENIGRNSRGVKEGMRLLG